LSPVDDYDSEMFRRNHIDDAAIESFFTGNGAGEELGPLAAFADELRTWASGPVPAPSAQLATMLADGFSTEKSDLLATAASNVPGPVQQAAGLPKWRKKRMISALLAGLSVPAKALIGISMAAASVGGAAAAGVPVAQDAVSAVTPVNFGQEVSTDARDGGVDGKEISEKAKARAEERRQDAEQRQDGDHRQDADAPSGAPEAPGSTGLDQANTTPGADHAPDSVPATPAAGSDNKPVETPAGPPAETPAAAPVSTPAGPPTSTPAGPPAGVPVGRP
jgi:hypothetical protein